MQLNDTKVHIDSILVRMNRFWVNRISYLQKCQLEAWITSRFNALIFPLKTYMWCATFFASMFF